MDVGCSNLLKTITDDYWNQREELSGYDFSEDVFNELRSRFFPYSVDILDLCSPFNDALRQVLEALPIIINNKTIAFVREYVNARKPSLISEIEKYEGIVAEREKYILLLKEIEKNEVSRINDNYKRKKEIYDRIKVFSEETIVEISDYFDKLINVDSLEARMRDRGVKNKKEDVDLFCMAMQDKIQGKCEKILTDKSKKLAEVTMEYISEYEKNISYSFKRYNVKADFDAAWAFVSALSKVGIVGGLGLFLTKGVFAGYLMSTFHHITIAGVSWLGPMGLIISASILAAIGAIRLFGGGWEKTVAKKIVSAFDTNEILERYRNAIREYWENTEKAFEQTSAKLEEEWEMYVEDLRSLVNEYDIDDIQNKILVLKRISDFFESIPL